MIKYTETINGKRYYKYQVAWIPTKFAQKNRVLKIKDEDGWIVKSGEGSSPLSRINANSRDYLHQRKASDI